MLTDRFATLRLPAEFLYMDHPFIYHASMDGGFHLLSDYSLTVDEGVDGDPNHPGGWKVIKGPLDSAKDIVYGTLDYCLMFVRMLTNTNSKLQFNEFTGKVSWEAMGYAR